MYGLKTELNGVFITCVSRLGAIIEGCTFHNGLFIPAGMEGVQIIDCFFYSEW